MVGVNVHTHFLVSLTNLENFSKENRMKLPAEVEFLPQEIWNKMRDELLVHLISVAITRTLSFFPDVSFLMSILSQKQTHQGCASGSAPAVPLLWGEALEPRVVHSTTTQLVGLVGGAGSQVVLSGSHHSHIYFLPAYQVE